MKCQKEKKKKRKMEKKRATMINIKISMMEEKMKTIITIEKPTTTGTIILKITTVKSPMTTMTRMMIIALFSGHSARSYVNNFTELN